MTNSSCTTGLLVATAAGAALLAMGGMAVAQTTKPDAETTKRLQDHVKATIAPYKYPRSVKFTTALPKTQTGKIQRFQLRNQGPS